MTYIYGMWYKIEKGVCFCNNHKLFLLKSMQI